MSIITYLLRAGLIFSYLLVLPAVVSAQSKTESEVFSYRLEDLKEVQDALKQVVSQEGKTVFLYDKRKVLVQDKADHFEIIRAIMKEFNPEKPAATPGPMVRVELFFNENNSGGQSGVSVDGRVNTGPVTIGNKGGGTGSGNKIRINAIERNMTSTTNQTSFLMVQSGSWARMNVSKEVSRPAYFYNVLSRFGYVQSGVVLERVNVGTMLEVAPTVRGNWIDLEITPVITSMENSKRRDFKVRELTTRVTVASGARVHIGGFQGVQDDFNSRFFGVSRRDASSQVGFAVRATLQEFGQ